MKASQTIVPIAMGLFPALSHAQAVWGWQMENVPKDGIKEITFPMDTTGTEHMGFCYYANQFLFVGHRDVGYAGLQPAYDVNGTSRIRGVISACLGNLAAVSGHPTRRPSVPRKMMAFA
ncbi:hypothetical protein P152DRAFT_458797 [Eremomyces bilateralis CBS 781.70]|uniref:Uncharacterized protein n=1 Tax=Eremomyces bilateralis CBS 781.70 TaxID=1392243 RepID=A0A6G1G300_9PEZI|nr:uncharacterized protein P152DRAFT_458797 [Eremomyces bilateralis CBS 781.70]KAF1812423.1 hypothetical protein P152DRAFT_458797 [Eremomyces bilateralis CBS 781.70]